LLSCYCVCVCVCVCVCISATRPYIYNMCLTRHHLLYIHFSMYPHHIATHCNTCSTFHHLLYIHSIMCPQHTATHCNTLQHIATHCNALQHVPYISSLALHPSHCVPSTLCNKLQRIATQCNTLLHSNECVSLRYLVQCPHKTRRRKGLPVGVR